MKKSKFIGLVVDWKALASNRDQSYDSYESPDEDVSYVSCTKCNRRHKAPACT